VEALIEVGDPACPAGTIFELADVDAMSVGAEGGVETAGWIVGDVHF